MADISFFQSDCVYQWPVRYEQLFNTIIVRVKLTSSGVSNSVISQKKLEWRDGIRSKWSGRYQWNAGSTAHFDIAWVESNQHQDVRVVGNSSRSAMDTWDVFDTGDVASHEFGHMLGLKDEYDYDISRCSGRRPTRTRSVMDVPANSASQRLVSLVEENRISLMEESRRTRKHADQARFSVKEMRRVDSFITIEMFGGNSGQRFRSSSVIDLRRSLRLTVSSDELRGPGVDVERNENVPSPAVLTALIDSSGVDKGARPVIVPGKPVAVVTVFVGGKRVTKVIELKESQVPREPGSKISILDQFTPTDESANILFDIIR